MNGFFFMTSIHMENYLILLISDYFTYLDQLIIQLILVYTYGMYTSTQTNYGTDGIPLHEMFTSRTTTTNSIGIKRCLNLFFFFSFFFPINFINVKAKFFFSVLFPDFFFLSLLKRVFSIFN